MESGDLVGRVVKACQAAIGAALSNPGEALAIAGGLQSTIATLNLVANETAKGDAGARHVIENAESLTMGALASVLAHAETGADASRLDVKPMLASLGPAVPRAAGDKDVKPGCGIPLFSQISREYIEMRGDNGAKSTELDTLELRRKTFIDVEGDRLVTDYYPRDLQDYVSRSRRRAADTPHVADRGSSPDRRQESGSSSCTAGRRRSPARSAWRPSLACSACCGR